MSGPIYNPVIPCVEYIPNAMQPGTMVRVQGTVPQNADRFAINLQCGPNTNPRDDIGLHLNFRFPEALVVRNDLQRGAWGSEELQGGNPLRPGAPFEALVLCEPQSFKIALNGQHFAEFMHRTAPQRITHLTIDGAVMVQMISFEGGQQNMGYQQAPPPYSGPQQGFGPPQGYGQPAYGQPAYGGPPPAYGAQQQYGGGYAQTYATPQRSGMGTGAAVGLGVGALATGAVAGGLAGYALGGGFSHDEPSDTVTVIEDSGDFGGDDWMD